MSGIDETEGKKNKYRVEGFVCRAVTHAQSVLGTLRAGHKLQKVSITVCYQMDPCKQHSLSNLKLPNSSNTSAEGPKINRKPTKAIKNATREMEKYLRLSEGDESVP